MKFGVIGLGAMGGTHVAMLKGEGVTAHAVCDTDEVKLEQYTASVKTTDYKDVIKKCEVVFIATPTYQHVFMALEALEAGRHIFLQKPMARTLGEAREIAKAVRESKKAFQVGYVMRFSTEMQKVKDFVAKIGSPVSWREVWTLNGQSYPQWLYEEGGGGPLFEDSHMIDFATWCIGKKPVSVSATAYSFNKTKFRDTISLLLTYEDGSSLLWCDSWARSGAGASNRDVRRIISVIGAGGHVIHPVKKPTDVPGATTVLYTWDGQEVDSVTWEHLGIGPAYGVEMQDFMARLYTAQNKKSAYVSSGCSAEEGLMLLKILDAAERSALLGGKSVIIK